MNLVRCLSLGTNRAGVLLTTRSPPCVRPQKPGHSWIVERCLSYSSIRLNEQSATGSTKFADAVNQTVLPDKELIDLTSINADPLNTAEQVIQSASTLNQVISATDIGLSAYFPPRLFYDFITTLHDSTGWAWVPSIAAACVVMRFCTFPLYVNSRKESTKFTEKMMNMQKEIIGFQPTGSLEQQLLARQEKAMSSMMEVQRSMPKFLMSPIASAVVFSSFYFCLRAMASHPLASMKAESFLWVPSLTAADPYFLFPALTASTLFLVLHYNMEAGAQIPKKLKRIFSLGLPSIIFAVTCTMPANLTIYWFINNNITVLFFFLCKQPTIKKYLGIPDPPDMSQVDMSRMASFQDEFRETLKQVQQQYDMEERARLIKQKQDQLDELRRLMKESERKEDELKKKRPD